ncbi:MAG: RHS repeat-associated core domain-containing protein [Bacteroidia bacterium]|nr:RHS repeat-associated core domain-containing protein [Bacteroidia bacterium]
MAGENTLVASPGNEYLYNGKELQDELGLGWYDYGARMYDRETSLFISPDPLADSTKAYSPYSYTLGNPIRYNDPTGMSAEDCCGDWFKNWPNVKIQTEVTLGAQVGIKVNNVIEANLEVISFKIYDDVSQIKEGELTSTKQALFYKIDAEKEGVEKTSIEVKNEAGFSVFGLGGSVGMSREMNSDTNTEGFKTFKKISGSEGLFSSEIIEETESGATHARVETGLKLSLKFILGIEVNFLYEKN